MKTLLAASLLLLLAVDGSLFAASPAPVKETKPTVSTGLGVRFKQVRDRIDTLYQHRLEPPVPFDGRSNPFRAPGAVPETTPVVTPGNGEPTPPPSGGNNFSLLQQAAATLKLHGTFEDRNRLHLVINARPYKEGDVFPVTVGGETVYVRVREISKSTRTVTLALNDAEFKMKF